MKERTVFLDKLRVAATCAVVLLHTVTGVMDHTDMGAYPLEKKVFLVILDLVCWCVPVFLLISGYLFLNPDRELGMRKMLLKYCRRIVLALFVFGVPYACLEQIAAERCFRWEMTGKAFLMVARGESWSHLWYLYLILILYLLTPAIRKLLAILPRPVLYILLAGLFAGSSVLPWLAKLLETETIRGLPDWGIYFFYYISGSLFRQKSGSLADTESPGAAKAIAGYAWTAAAVRAAAMACSRLNGNYTVQMAYNYPFTTVLSLLIFGGGSTLCRMVPWEGKAMDGFWKQAAGLCFAVYLVHPVFLNTAYKFLHVTPLSFPIGISLPVFWGAALLLSAAAARILCGIPTLKRYVL